jgi:hypothetical protein
LLLTVVVILAGCGGAGAEKTPQLVRGPGFHFGAPDGWDVRRSARTVAAEHGDVDRVQVTRFRLAKRYEPALFAAATRELDRVAEQLARRLGGRVVSRKTVVVDHRNSRWYRIEYNGRVHEITFVLDGRREYELLCRREKDGDDAACRTLVRTFALRPA